MMPPSLRSASPKIGIFAHFDPSWTGGERYVRNVISALSERHDIPVVLYARPEFNTDGLARPGLEIRAPSALARYSPAWWSSKIAERLDRRALDPISRLIEQDGIDVTYLRPVHVSGGSVPNVHWVPDLQHRHLPEMYTEKQMEKCERVEQRAVRCSAKIVASSHVVRDHLLDFQPAAASKLEVLRFAVDLPRDVFLENPLEVCRRHDLPERFLLFPGQLWKHKNHQRLFEALAMFEDGDDSPTVVCTGATVDFRSDAYLQRLLTLHAKLGLTSKVRLLGLLPRNEFYALLRRAIAVLNPSLFEGWSTPVEEAKALGVPLLLSDIAVHQEQAPSVSAFFDPRSVDGMANAISTIWKGGRPGPYLERERRAAIANQQRRHLFADEFIRIVNKATTAPEKQRAA